MTSTKITDSMTSRRRTDLRSRSGHQLGLVALEYVVIESLLAVAIIHFGPLYTTFFSGLFEQVLRVLGQV